VNSYSITYNTYVGGVVDMTTKLITAAKFYFEGDVIFFIDDAKEVVFAVPTSRQPVVQVVTS
jgi:hypothetical protein